jgi:hypothetical protein
MTLVFCGFRDSKRAEEFVAEVRNRFRLEGYAFPANESAAKQMLDSSIPPPLWTDAYYTWKYYKDHPKERRRFYSFAWRYCSVEIEDTLLKLAKNGGGQLLISEISAGLSRYD